MRSPVYDMEEQSIFNFEKFKLTKPIRLIETFAGVGSQAMSLRNIGANFTHYKVCEIDSFAVKSYNAIHHTDFVPTDITKLKGSDLEIVDIDKYDYVLTYSFPCTDLSNAGARKGMSRKDWEEGKATRSGLLWEIQRILSELSEKELPTVLLMENVPQVVADQNIDDFRYWQDYLTSLGYFNFTQIMNASDYGLPQNRERCFMVSIKSNDFIDYSFPKKIPLQLTVKDLLEKEVDAKYYLPEERTQSLIDNYLMKGNNLKLSKQELACLQKTNKKGFLSINEAGLMKIGTDIASTITARYYKGVSGNGDNMVIEMVDFRYDEGIRSKANPNISPTLPSSHLGTESLSGQPFVLLKPEYKIRRLTPKECWKLMGFTEEDYINASKVNSETQLYKQAGNSICVCCLEKIFKELI